MAEIVDHVDVQAILETAQALAKGFGVQLFIVDDPQIPIDVRFTYTTKATKADDFSEGTIPRGYADVFFGQKRVAEELMIGRWASAATSPYYVCGAGYEKDYAVWELISDGSFAVQDNSTPTPKTDILTAIDFDGATTLTQVLGILNAALAAIGSPNITGITDATFAIDARGRLALKMATTGSSAPTISIISDATGTDLSPLFDIAKGFAVSGFDAETPTEAVTAISEIDNSWYNLHERGCDDDEQVSLGTYIEGLEKLCDLVLTDTDAKNPAISSDVGSQLQALTTRRTMCIYTEHTDQYPDAAVAGAVLPAQEGTTNFAHEQLSLVTDSGLTKSLTKPERNALKAKNICWIQNVGGIVEMYNGITSGKEEKRVMLGRDWYVARIREAIFSDMVNDPLHAFDNPTMTKVEGRIREVSNEAHDREIIVNTPARPLTISIPDADTFTKAERASHKAEIFNAFTCYINSAINDYLIVGTWTL
jgi:hypothetical protein